MTLTADWLSLLEKAEKTAILEDDVILKVSFLDLITYVLPLLILIATWWDFISIR